MPTHTCLLFLPAEKLHAPPKKSAPRSSKVRQPRYTVVLDLNGFLVHRSFDKGRKLVPRPGCADFLKVLTNKATVVIWSCAIRKNVDSMLKVAFGGSGIDIAELEVMSQSDVTESSFPRPGNNIEKKYMLKDLKKVRNFLDHVDLDLTLLIDDSPEKNLLNDEFSAIHPESWAGDLKDKFLMTIMLPWLENMFSSNLPVAEFVRNNPLVGCVDPARFRLSDLAQNIITGCSKKWDSTRGAFN